MSEKVVELLESRIVEAAERMRDLASRHGALTAEVERLRGEMAVSEDERTDRTRAAREALRLALAELRED